MYSLNPEKCPLKQEGRLLTFFFTSKNMYLNDLFPSKLNLLLRRLYAVVLI